MRLKDYLQEENYERPGWLTPEEAAKKIKKECQPFLKEIHGAGFLWRGSDRSTRKGIEIIVPRKDRHPKDMPKVTHDMIDKILKKKFGWKPRSEGVFCSPVPSVAQLYGLDNYVYLIFPRGPFKYLWSPEIYDLFTELKRENLLFHDKPDKKDIRFTYDYEDFKKILDTYTDKNLKEAIKRGVEITIKCNSYYFVEDWYTFQKPIKELIK